MVWNVTFEPGTVKVVARKEGRETASQEIHTAGEPAQIRLTPDRRRINTDGTDLSFVTVEVLDKDGNLCPNAENLVQFSLKGAARIAGVDNGSPISLERFKDDKRRYGIRFRRIPGKKSYSRATADNPELVGQYAEEFADMCLKLHTVHVDKNKFECVKDRYYRLLTENPFFSTRQKERIGQFISDVPDNNTALHGDLQFSNAIFSGTDRYFIDLGDFCYGYYLFDVGMVYLCCCLSDESFIEETFHMHKQLSIKFWQNFAPAYFGTDRTLRDIEEEIRPFAGLKTLIVERDTNCPMPGLRSALTSIL